MKRRLLYAVFGSVVLCSWTIQHKNPIEKASWLIGTWENKTPKGSIYETWIRISDNEFSGKSYILKEKDTIIFETIRLVQEQDGLFYIPTVKNQNDGSAVRFALKSISDTAMVFANSQHDFPQIISYTRINTDRLVAEISGTNDGRTRKQTFPMNRMK